MKRKHLKYFQERHYAIAEDRIRAAGTYAILVSGVPFPYEHIQRIKLGYFKRLQILP